MREGHPKTEHRAAPAEMNGDSRHHQMTSPGVSSSSKSVEQHHPPPRSHPGTPQPMAYRPTPPAVPYHVPNQVKVISCHPTSCFPFSIQTFLSLFRSCSPTGCCKQELIRSGIVGGPNSKHGWWRAATASTTATTPKRLTWSATATRGRVDEFRSLQYSPCPA